MSYEFERWKSKAKLIGIYDDYIFIDIILDNNIIPGIRTGIALQKYRGKSKSIVLPPVDIIKDAAFSNNKFIEEITIGHTVKSIGKSCFRGCKNLKKVTFIDSRITVLDYKVFYKCEKLSEINLPDTVERIEVGAFGDCIELKHIDLNNTEYIQEYAFIDSGLCSITLPKTVEYLGEAFIGCDNLREMTILTNIVNTDEYTRLILSSALETIYVNNENKAHITNILDSKFKDKIKLMGVM